MMPAVRRACHGATWFDVTTGRSGSAPSFSMTSMAWMLATF
ncbi:MAG: hypothetical protein V3T02_00050 [Alphaproteobacteria bacterium]